MNRVDLTEDGVFFLYLSPFIISGLHGLIIWVREGITVQPSLTLFLTVTKDPLTFVLGVMTLGAAVVLDVHSAQRENRRITLRVNSRRLQLVAVISLLTSIVFAWVASGYTTNLFRAFTVFLSGRYSIVFPLTLFAFSVFLSIPADLTAGGGKAFVQGAGLALLLISPLALFALSRLHYSVSNALAVSLAMFAAGLTVTLYSIVKRRG